jgi:tripartite-type tricarboxylate transporter receptor subunit TctC
MKRSALVGILLTLCLMIGLLTFSNAVYSAEGNKYPEKTIICILPAKPGGGLDTIARIASQYIPKYLPQEVTMIVQNVDAAGGRVAAFQVYDAKPDGYTIALFDPLTFVMTDALGQMGGRSIDRITWLYRASTNPYAMAVSPDGPVKNLEDLKGKKLFASASQATLPGSVAILRFLGADPKLMLYGGGSESCLAVMRGDVDIVAQVAGTVISQAKSSAGKLVPIAVFADDRLPDAPQVPTTKELGIKVPDGIMALLASDNVFVAPYGLPQDVYKALTEAMDKAFRDPGFIEQAKKAGRTVNVLTPKEVEQRVRNAATIMPKYISEVREAMETTPKN